MELIAWCATAKGVWEGVLNVDWGLEGGDGDDEEDDGAGTTVGSSVRIGGGTVGEGRVSWSAMLGSSDGGRKGGEGFEGGVIEGGAYTVIRCFSLSKQIRKGYRTVERKEKIRDLGDKKVLLNDSLPSLGANLKTNG